MFKDTKDGTTHSFNDGCGEPAHNKKSKCCDRCKDYDPCYKISCPCHTPVTESTPKVVPQSTEVEECKHGLDEGCEDCIHPIKTEEVESWWEDEYARDIGMCCDGCDCGHCKMRRKIINKILSSNTERVKRDLQNEKWEFYSDEHTVKRHNEALDRIINKLN